MTETRERPAPKPEPAGGRGGRRSRGDRLGLGARVSLYVRQVVAELRKVIWPARNELVTYTTVVVVFVTAMMIIVGLLDLGFTKVAFKVFG